MFDFSNMNIGESRKRLKQLEEHHLQLRKSINTKVMDMIDRYVTGKDATLF